MISLDAVKRLLASEASLSREQQQRILARLDELVLQQVQSMVDQQETGGLGKRSHTSDRPEADSARTDAPGKSPSFADFELAAKPSHLSQNCAYQDATKSTSLKIQKQTSKTQHIKQPATDSEIRNLGFSGQNAIVAIGIKRTPDSASRNKKSVNESKTKEPQPGEPQPQQSHNKTTVLIKDRTQSDLNASSDQLSSDPKSSSGGKSNLILNYLTEGQAMELVSLGSTTTFFLMTLFDESKKTLELQSVNLKAKKYKRIFDVKQLTHGLTLKVGRFELLVLQTSLAVAPLMTDPRIEPGCSPPKAQRRYQTLFTLNSTKFVYMVIEQKENWFEEQIRQENLYVNEIGRGAHSQELSDPNNSIIHMSFDRDLSDSFAVISKIGEQGYVHTYRGSENSLGRATIDVEFPRQPFNLKLFGTEGIFSHVEYMSSTGAFVLMGVFAEKLNAHSKKYRYFFCAKVMAFVKQPSIDGKERTAVVEIKTLCQDIPDSLSNSGRLFEVCASRLADGKHQFKVLIKNTTTLLRLTLHQENLEPKSPQQLRISFEQVDLNETVGDLELESGEQLRVSAIAKNPDEEGKYLIAYGNKYCEVLLADN
jgi:hypothetical protein